MSNTDVSLFVYGHGTMDGFLIDLKEQLTPGALAAGAVVAAMMAVLTRLLAHLPRENDGSQQSRYSPAVPLMLLLVLGTGTGCVLLACSSQASDSDQKIATQTNETFATPPIQTPKSDFVPVMVPVVVTHRENDSDDETTPEPVRGDDQDSVSEPVSIEVAVPMFVSAENVKNEVPESKEEEVQAEATYRNSIGMDFRWVPAGEFQMGSLETERNRTGDSETQQRVQITKPFYTGVYEVTQAEFQRVMGYNPSFFPSVKTAPNAARFPVDSVNWFEAVVFCNTLSRLEGRTVCYSVTDVQRDSQQRIIHAMVELQQGNGYRLPTEAEWEYSCRAGTQTVFTFGNTLSGDEANVDGRRPYGTAVPSRFRSQTVPVGSFAPNRWGLHDVHGNVFEWVQDTPSVQLPGGSDPQPFSFELNTRGLRGGSYASRVAHCRSATRPSADAKRSAPDTGFRIVLTAQ